MNIEEQILNDYLGYSSTSDIALKYGLDKDDVKLILRTSLGLQEYLRISRTIGGRAVAKKMKSTSYRSQYISKMRSSVSYSITSRMTNPKYRAVWRKKAKQGSVSGNQKIIQLLQESDFSKRWNEKCCKGGHIVKNLRLGIFDPALAERRKEWSITGLSRTARKLKGPMGERMYNYLEVLVAKIFVSQKIRYVYECPVGTSRLNGFYSVDFVLPDLLLLVEVTYWDKIDEKCASLKGKFNALQKSFPDYKFVLVTKRSKQDRYKRLLQDYNYVLTPSELKNFVAEVSKPLKRGNKFQQE
jgi:hypothetical protein